MRVRHFTHVVSFTLTAQGRGITFSSAQTEEVRRRVVKLSSAWLPTPFSFHFTAFSHYRITFRNDRVVMTICSLNIPVVSTGCRRKSKHYDGIQVCNNQPQPILHISALSVPALDIISVLLFNSGLSQTPGLVHTLSPRCNSSSFLLYPEVSLPSLWSHVKFHLLFTVKSANGPLP